jgi:hypothetical protein
VVEWSKIGALNWVLEWLVLGFPIRLMRSVVEDGWTYSLDQEQLWWMVVEVEWVEGVGTAKLVGLGPTKPARIHFVSLVFLVPKKGPKWWWMVST